MLWQRHQQSQPKYPFNQSSSTINERQNELKTCLWAIYFRSGRQTMISQPGKGESDTVDVDPGPLSSFLQLSQESITRDMQTLNSLTKKPDPHNIMEKDLGYPSINLFGSDRKLPKMMSVQNDPVWLQFNLMAVFINHFEYSDPVHLSQLMAFLSSNTNYIGPLSQLWSVVLLIIRKVEALYFYISKLCASS